LPVVSGAEGPDEGEAKHSAQSRDNAKPTEKNRLRYMKPPGSTYKYLHKDRAPLQVLGAARGCGG